MNVEVFKVNEGTLNSQGGLFADGHGNVKALWMSFSIDNERRELSSILGGVSARLILPTVNRIKSDKDLTVRGLDAEFWPLQICNARIIGVPDRWLDKLKEKSTKHEQPVTAIYVLGITDVSSPSGKLLKPGDIVLSINDNVVNSVSDFSKFNDQDELNMVIYILKYASSKTQLISFSYRQFSGMALNNHSQSLLLNTMVKKQQKLLDGKAWFFKIPMQPPKSKFKRRCHKGCL